MKKRILEFWPIKSIQNKNCNVLLDNRKAFGLLAVAEEERHHLGCQGKCFPLRYAAWLMEKEAPARHSPGDCANQSFH